MPSVRDIGKSRCIGKKPYAWFDEGGLGRAAMARLFRHRPDERDKD